MGMFQQNNVKIKKEEKENGNHYFLDYYRDKDPRGFVQKLLGDMIADHCCLAILDTNLVYKSTKKNVDKEMEKVTELLDHFSIGCRKVVTKGEASSSVFGIPVKLNNSEKVNNYIIGFAVSMQDLKNIGDIIHCYNIHYYLFHKEEDSDELLNRFRVLNGDMMEWDGTFEYEIYHDNFLRQFKITADSKHQSELEQILLSYTKSIGIMK